MVDKIQAACCDVRLSYNAGIEVSLQSVPITVDNTPIIEEIEPTTSPLEGGVNITVRGFGFIPVVGNLSVVWFQLPLLSTILLLFVRPLRIQ